MTSYVKPHLTYKQQVELLIQRGMVIDEPQFAEALLSRIGYYRLSGYWYPYRVAGDFGRGDQFAPGTTLGHVVALYDMDRRLKLLVLDAVERVEITMRIRVGYTLGQHDPYAHLDPVHLDGQFCNKRIQGRSRYERWLERVAEAQTRSTEDFVAHFGNRYGGRLPIWVVTEIMDFGLLSYLYEGAKRADRDAIAGDLKIFDNRGCGNGLALVNWMRVLNYLRNVCAHHSRLWNRNMTLQVAPTHLKPSRPLAHVASANPAARNRVYAGLCVLGFLMREIAPGSTWHMTLKETLTSGLESSNRSVAEMGFTEDWTGQLLWSD